ncbi:hypothetical protein CPC16_006539 [Podila verticillata]|nr:hypothetical protein CPC16_006539 [Podila verticillata]
MHPQQGKHSNGPSHHRSPSPTKKGARPTNATGIGAHKDTQPHNVISINAASGAMPSSETTRNASSSTAPMPSNFNTECQSKRPAATDVMASFPEQHRLGLMLSEVTRVVEKRELDYEVHIERLNNTLSSLRRRELKWSAAAKMYKQDRNYMSLRLAELEREIVQKLGGQLGVEEQGNERNAHLMMVYQKITKMVDDLTTDSSEQRESNPANRSQPSAPDTTVPSDCACTHGCREELRVLRARCKLAENHVELLKVKCEKERNAISTYRSRLDKWRESSQAIIRDTNRRRKEVQRQSFHPEAPQRRHNHRHLRSHPQYPSRVGQVHFGPVKVTRLPAEDSDASQRTETTRQNTLLNRYNSQLPVDTNYHAATSNSYSGTGSRSEPHVLDADDDADEDDVTPVSDTDASGGNTNYRVMSPSLPSELELRRRQVLAESESEEDSEHSDEQGETSEKLVHRGTNPTESTSPIARALRGHQQTPAGATSSSLGGDGVNSTANKPFANQGHATTKRNQDLSLPSDHSSPPMFDFTDHNDTDHGRRNTNALKSPTAADSESDDERDDFHPPPRPQFIPKAPETHEEEALIVESTPQELQGASSRSHVRQMLAAGAIKGKQFVEDELVIQNPSRHDHRQRNDNEGWITSTKPKYSRQSIHPRQEDYDFLTENASGAGPSFYQMTGPLPLPDGYNAFFTPAPRPGQSEVWEQTPQERLNQRIQTVSRHRVQHAPPPTPPGYWDVDFPLTPERQEWDRIALERKNRKKQRLEETGPSSSSRK